MTPHTPDAHPYPPVVIVGGGIAGLAAAYELHRRGVKFQLLEQRPRFGGVIFSEPFEQFVIDGGPDSLLVQKPEGIALCRELGLGDRLVSTKLPRLSYIQRDGVLHPIPAQSVLGIPTRVGPFVTSRLFSLAGKLRMGAEIFVPRRQDDADESIGSFMTRRFGQEATTYLAEPLLAGIHHGDVNRLSIRALFPRFVQAEAEHGSLLRAFRRQQRDAAPGDGPFRSLPRGLSEIVEALVKALPAESIRTGMPVLRVERDGGELHVICANGERVTARALILATPAFATAALVRPFNPSLSALCGEIEYVSAATVALAFRREAIHHPLNGSGFVVPRVEHTGITAGSWMSSKWPNRAPEGHALLRAFVGGMRDPHVLEKSDAELIAIVLHALTPLLRIAGTALFTRVYRWERANAQHDVGHLARVEKIERELLREPGVYLTGSGFRGVGIPDVVADARATAKQVSAWLDGST